MPLISIVGADRRMGVTSLCQSAEINKDNEYKAEGKAKKDVFRKEETYVKKNCLFNVL